MTVAGVGTAMLVVPYELGSPQHREISKQVLNDFLAWDRQARGAIDDFFEFAIRGMENDMESPETIGGWELYCALHVGREGTVSGTNKACRHHGKNWQGS